MGKVIHRLLLQTINEIFLCSGLDEVLHLLKLVREQIVVRHCYLYLRIFVLLLHQECQQIKVRPVNATCDIFEV